MLNRVLLVVLLGALLAPVASAAAKGEPRGVYTGAVKGVGTKCTGCRLRIVVSDDGLEVTKTTRWTGRIRVGTCASFDVRTSRYATIKDNRFSSEFVVDGTIYRLFGRLNGRTITGRGSIGCLFEDGAEFTYVAHLSGHAPATANCDRAEIRGKDATTTVMVRERTIGCSRAHAAAVALMKSACAPACTLAGMACGPLASPALGDPAAQTSCTSDTGVAELTMLTSCERGSDTQFRTPQVTCEEATALGFGPDDSCGGKRCVRNGFECGPASDQDAERDARYTERCDDPADPRRVVLLYAYEPLTG